MGKKDLQVTAAIIFASVLSIFALTGGNTERGEVRQIEDAIRNLRRADNLQLTCSYTISDRTETVTNRIDVWADQLTSSWVAEYYTTDVDGTRMYLKRLCDGKYVYTYIDWSGEWSSQKAGQEVKVPCLDTISTIEYGNEDIMDVEKLQEGDILEISYTLTPEYLEAQEGQSEEPRIEKPLIVYKIDKNEVLRSGNCSYTVYQPVTVTEEDGTIHPDGEQKIMNLFTFEIKGYNQDIILDKIEQYESEI